MRTCRDDQAGLFPRHFVSGYYLEALQAYLITMEMLRYKKLKGASAEEIQRHKTTMRREI
jgi:hypothetical protein